MGSAGSSNIVRSEKSFLEFLTLLDHITTFLLYHLLLLLLLTFQISLTLLFFLFFFQSFCADFSSSSQTAKFHVLAQTAKPA
jgi:hypothetical protein